MVPRIIVDRLARVRSKERTVRTAWGLARTAGLALAALLVAGLVDWAIDRRADTPGAVRLLLLAGQIGLWAWAGWTLVLRPLLAPWSDRDVALWVEARHPELHHGLITAVELNREGADTRGMSAELLAATTRQAEERATATDFSDKVETRRGRRSDLVLAGAAVAVLLGAVAAPETAGALLARVFLADREIPRSVRLEVETAERVCPSGEEVLLRFRARGEIPPGATGLVRVEPEGRPSESYPLTPEGPGVYQARVPPAAVAFAYRGWLRDGRTRKAGRILYEPRPVVKAVEAAVLLPGYVGARPDGRPYEQSRPRGEIAGPKGSSARVTIEVQKPVVKAEIETLGRTSPEAPDAVLRRIPMAIGGDGRQAEATFDLRLEESTYRVLVEDRHGFANTVPPRRGVVIVPDEAPKVALLPERFALPGEETPTEDSEIEGAPIPLGGAIRVAYYAAHPYGLSKARLAWRVIKGGTTADGSSPSAEGGAWKFLPLGEVKETEESGPFDVRRGKFRHSGFRDAVEFHPMPSPDPARVPGGLEGGGCFDFQTRSIPGLQVGDQIEFLIEAFARNPELAGSPGRSETRVKAFVTQPQFVDWVLQTLRHESRLRQLESRQRSVFAPEGADR